MRLKYRCEPIYAMDDAYYLSVGSCRDARAYRVLAGRLSPAAQTWFAKLVSPRPNLPERLYLVFGEPRWLGRTAAYTIEDLGWWL